MGNPQPEILIVDDVEVNRSVLEAILSRAGYPVATAFGGEEALALLEAEPRRFGVILLDRMMPGMDGLEVIARLKEHEILRVIPVILQTAMVDEADVLEGLEAGAYFYLTKPIKKATLLAVVRTVVTDYARHAAARSELQKMAGALAMLRTARFECRSLDESRDLATILAGVCPAPEKAVIGLSELLINAVEHGNLGITYDEKTELNAGNRLLAEVERRLALPEHAEKAVTVDVEHGDDAVRFRIRDCGEGFDWSAYVDVDPTRILDTHGRGIAMAKLISFDRVDYVGCGNEVHVEVRLEPSAGEAVAVDAGAGRKGAGPGSAHG